MSPAFRRFCTASFAAALLLSAATLTSPDLHAECPDFLTAPHYSEVEAQVRLGDLNGDGRKDLVYYSYPDGGIVVRLMDATGSAQPASVYPLPAAATSLVLADFDEDGDLDAAVGSSSALSVVPGDGLGGFGSAAPIGSFESQTILSAVDVNADGHVDLAARIQSNSISIFPGNGDATFGAPITTDLGGTFSSQVLAKFDGDAHPDLAIVRGNQIYVHGGSATGAFGNGTAIPAMTALALVAGDFNEDTKIDLAAARGSSVAILTGNGDLTFTLQSETAAPGADRIAADDITGDAHLDVLLTGINAGHLSLLAGDGAGSLAPPVGYAAGVSAIALPGDVDGNGDVDVVQYSGIGTLVMLNDGNGNLAAAASSRVGDSPQDVVAGDFNDDGVADLATANQTSGDLSVLLGLGTGRFAPAVTYGTGSGARSLVSADFDTDGLDDLAVLNRNAATISVLSGNSDGTFDEPTQIALGPGSLKGIVAGDFNEDGHADLVAGAGSSVVFLAGDGNGAFAATVALPFTTTETLTLGDFDADGFLDLVTISSGALVVRLGNGDGTFDTGVSYSGTFTARSVIARDLNLDGALDLAAVSTSSSSVAVRLGNGDGTFGAQALYTSGTQPYDVEAADFNDDGRVDLAVASNSSGVAILLGFGDGTFVAPFVVPVSRPTALAAADFNSDGKIDLGVTAFGVVTLLNRGECHSENLQITTHPVSRSAGSSSATFAIASVLDDVDEAVELTVTAADPPAGITVTDIRNDVGLIRATVTVGCDVTPGAHNVTMQVQDTGGATASADLVVDVTPNPAPVLGTYNDVLTRPTPSGITVTRVGAYPSDNGIFTLQGTATPSMTGSVSVVQSSGNVTITNGNPGTHGITVQSTDNCGLTTERTFSLEIVCVELSKVSTTVPSSHLAAAADFNGDGNPDLATATRYPDGIYIASGNGDGTLGAVTSFFENLPGGLLAGDFDRDGNMDLASLATDGVSIHIGNGTGAFASKVTYEPRSASFIALGDFNADGNPDLATASGSSVAILLGSGTGAFTDGGTFSFGTGSATALAVDDLDGDGRSDVLVSLNSGAALAVYLATTAGTFTLSQTLAVNSSFRPQAMVTGSFNGDPFVDTAMVISGSVIVAAGNGDGTFGSLTYHSVPTVPDPAIVSADFDGDGILDLFANGSKLLLGTGTTFRAAIAYDGFAGRSMAIADFNRDGRPDLATGGSQYAGLLLSSGSCNAAPILTPAAITSRAAATPPSAATLASVTDATHAASAPIVTVRSVPEGITITDLTNDNGTITALVGATCDASAGTHGVLLRATDPDGAFHEALVSIEVTANTPPDPGSYADASIAGGTSSTLSPASPPSDNSAITSIEVMAQPGFTGTVSADPDTAEITISDAAPVGTHTISVTTTDDCGGSSASSFTLTVLPASTITVVSGPVEPSTVGQTVTFVATVTSQMTGTITGIVTFHDGDSTIGTGVLNNGTASFSTSSLSLGEHTITATYEGAAAFESSTSPGITHTVVLAPFGPPQFITATATGTSTVTVQWTPVADATGYELHRSSNGAAFTMVASGAITSVQDTVAAGQSHLYRVRAIGTGEPSGFGPLDVATTVVFSDPSLTNVRIKAVHVNQLRTAANALLVAAGQTARTWPSGAVSASTRIRAAHITELRDAITTARAAIPLSTVIYTDETITAGVTQARAAHIQELRAAVQ